MNRSWISYSSSMVVNPSIEPIHNGGTPFWAAHVERWASVKRRKNLLLG